MNIKHITPMEMGFEAKTHDYETYYVITDVTDEQWYRVAFPISNAISIIIYVMGQKNHRNDGALMDAVADFLEANEFNICCDKYELQDNDASEEDYICCGNHGVYIPSNFTITPVDEL